MATELAGAPGSAGAAEDVYARPTERLPWVQLLQISIYWFGINAIWGGWEVLNQEKVPALFGENMAGRAMVPIELLAALVAIAVQPTVGCISDYTMSRWGRRKPYIAIGATLDVFFLLGIATANTPIVFIAFLLALEFSSNFAQGPFQGYIPDLVPEPQVGLASALVGTMSTLGVIGGVLFLSFGYRLGEDFTIPALVLGGVEFATAMATVILVREGRQAKPREGRSWLQIALGAWGTDILRERSYVWLLVSRFFLMAAGAFVANWAIIWMERALGFGSDEKGTWVTVILGATAVCTAISTIPAAKVSDRVGRKPVIWVGAAVAAVGTAVFAFAPVIEVALVGGVLVGIGSGMILAVDWALLSELVPKASSGRYMGMSNLASALQAVIAVLFGGLVLDIVANGFFGVSADFAASARWAIGIGVLFYLAGCLLLIPVREPERRGTPSGALGTLGGAG
ncbi:MAG: transporter [Chloroflexi bacterium]|nr:transporter [Chloroflexota bacterium]